MLELLHGGTGGVRPTYPNSGPGTKVLQYGNEEIGYFGEVTGAQLFTPKEYMTLARAYFGNHDNTADALSNIWLKYFFKGKVVFIAKIPFAANVNWNEIYLSGLVYGTQNNGKYPAGNEPTWQYNPLFKQEGQRNWALIPRLIKGVATDPFTTFNDAAYTGSEWTELVGRCFVGPNPPVSEKWASFSVADLRFDTNRYFWAQETDNANVNNALYLTNGSATFFTRTSLVKTYQAMWYRPVLELVDAANGGVFPAANIKIKPSEDIADIWLLDTDIEPGDPDLNLGINNIRIEDQGVKDLLVTYSFDPSTPSRPNNINGMVESSDWKLFGITGVYVEPSNFELPPTYYEILKGE
jgi:hypothetical protein